MISAKILLDSIGPTDVRLTTFELCYPKYIHVDFLTHRVFSRSARSSRAVPVSKILQEVRTDPVVPFVWGTNKPGMQAGAEMVGEARKQAERCWRRMANEVALSCESRNELGLHKQWANRPLEAFTNIYVVVTSCYWRNFYALRRDEYAQPDLIELADQMFNCHLESTPQRLAIGQWHLPYITDEDRSMRTIEELRMISAARCARVSYRTHNNRTPTLDEDMSLFERLMGAQPLHASPTEHQATPNLTDSHLWGNFYQWAQFRKTIPGESGQNAPCMIPNVL